MTSDAQSSETGSDRPGPTLSVILTCTEAGTDLQRSLDALGEACDGLSAEIIVVDGSPDGGAAAFLDRVGTGALAVRLQHPRALVPHLWAAGVEASRGEVVALTTGEMRVEPTWARTLVGGIDAGAAAAGGPLRLARQAGPTSWAVFYLRHWRFLEGEGGARRPVAQLPGENIAYRRDQLTSRPSLLSHGLWEVELNDAIVAEGGQLSSEGGAAAEFRATPAFSAMLRNRFVHGRHSGASRVRRGDRQAWQVVMAAPAVPFVLALRAGRRALAATEHRLRFVLALPWLLMLAGAWAAGEAWGATQGSGIASMADVRGAP